MPANRYPLFALNHRFEPPLIHRLSTACSPFARADLRKTVPVLVVPQDERALRLIYKPGSGWGEGVVYFDLGE